MYTDTFTLKRAGWRRTLLASITLSCFLLTICREYVLASSWNPTLLVNTEAFQVVDEGSANTDVEIRFGDSLNERILWNRALSLFQVTDDLSVQGILSGSVLRIDGAADIHGALAVTGAIKTDSNFTINDDQTAADAVVTFGSDGTNETLTFANTLDRFEVSDDLFAFGTLSGYTVHASTQLRSSGTLLTESGVYLDGTSLVVQAGNNYVGVGTAGPLSPLHITAAVSPHNSRGQFSINSTDTSNSFLTFFTNDSATVDKGWIGYSSSALQVGTSTVNVPVTLHTNQGEAVRVTAGRNVGIGDTNPDTKLEVVGTISGAVVYGKDSLRSSGALTWEGTGSGASLYVGDDFEGAGLSDCDADEQTVSWDATNKRFGCGDDDSGGAAGLVDHYVRASGDAMTGGLIISNGNPALTIDSGLLLEVVGTASGRTVHAQDGLRSSGTIVTESGANIDAGTLYVSAPSSKVGIGTTAPGGKFVVSGGTSDTPLLGATAGTPSNALINLAPSSDDIVRFGLRLDTSENMHFDYRLFSGGSPTTAMTIERTAGKIGIGTTNPETMLDVVGTVSGSNLTFMGASSSYILGSVGIGTTTPDTGIKLEVVGTISGSLARLTSNIFGSGSLFLESHLTGATLAGFGLTNCTGGNALRWNSSTNKFECAADAGGSGLSISDGDARYVNQNGDTMTGALQLEYGSGDVLTVSGGVIAQTAYGSPVMLSGANIGAAVRSIYVSGKYAFVGSDSVSGNDLRIFDVHNRAAPTLIGGIDIGANVNVIIRVGKFLYVGTSTVAGTCARNTVTGCEFRIYDVSNLASPVAFGGVDLAIGVNDIQLAGELAYIVNDTVSGTCTANTGATLTGCEFRVYDVSNPYGPVAIGGMNDTVDARALYISGQYAYVVYDSDSGAANELKIFSIHNHSNINAVGGINAGVASLHFNTIAVSGKYAYIGTSADGSTCSGSTVTGCEFRVYDVGNPTSPSDVGGLDFAISVNAIEIAASTAFAGLSSVSGNELRSIDIQNPAAPVVVGGREMGIGINSVVTAGKFFYLGSDNQASGLEFFLLDAPGIEAPTATIGSLQSSNLTITESARINNTLFIGNGLNIGRGGVNLRGPLSVQSTSTGSLYTGLEIKNLTGTTMFSVRDDGFADALRAPNGFNGFLGQEFNWERASVTADQTAWADDTRWIGDVSANTCTFRIDENFPTFHRSQITAASVGCNLFPGIAAGDPMNFISSTGSLARVLMKVRVNSAASTARSFLGMFSTIASGNTTEPTDGIYFTGSGASYTEWQATVNPTAAGVSTYIRCPGATIQTGFNKFALLDITVESKNRVRFRVDPDMTNGIDFINCGYGNPGVVTSPMTVAAILATNASFSGTAQQDIDYIRVWTTSY